MYIDVSIILYCRFDSSWLRVLQHFRCLVCDDKI